MNPFEDEEEDEVEGYPAFRAGIYNYDNMGDFIRSGGSMGPDLFPRNPKERVFFEDLARQHVRDPSAYTRYGAETFGTDSPDYIRDASLAQYAGPMAANRDRLAAEFEQAVANRPTQLAWMEEDAATARKQAQLDAGNQLTGNLLELSDLAHSRRLDEIGASRELHPSNVALNESMARYYDANVLQSMMPTPEMVEAGINVDELTDEQRFYLEQKSAKISEITQLIEGGVDPEDEMLLPLKQEVNDYTARFRATIPPDTGFVDPNFNEALMQEGYNPLGELDPIWGIDTSWFGDPPDDEGLKWIMEYLRLPSPYTPEDIR